MDEITAPSRARKFWMFLACASTVYAMMYAGSATQTKIDLFGGTNATCVGAYNLIVSVAEPVVTKIRKA